MKDAGGHFMLNFDTRKRLIDLLWAFQISSLKATLTHLGIKKATLLSTVGGLDFYLYLSK